MLQKIEIWRSCQDNFEVVSTKDNLLTKFDVVFFKTLEFKFNLKTQNSIAASQLLINFEFTECFIFYGESN